MKIVKSIHRSGKFTTFNIHATTKIRYNVSVSQHSLICSAIRRANLINIEKNSFIKGLYSRVSKFRFQVGILIPRF
eukprot:13203.XXX_454928_455155_1 [CDS] Oithona nana genome sequencing.